MVRRPQKAKGSVVQREEEKSNGCTLIILYWLLWRIWPKKYYLTEEVYLAENFFKNSARHECKRILPKSVKT